MNSGPVPCVAIVGRPNVGKSSLLNRLAGRRISIVDPMSGVTRDRVTARIKIDGRPMELVDTGGIGIVDTLQLEEQVDHQVNAAVGAADLILFVVDLREGVTPLDLEVAARLRRTAAPVVLVGNKAESGRLRDEGAGELHALGFGDPVLVSAAHGHGMDDLGERLAEQFPASGAPAADAVRTHGIQLALVGRTNVGKSSLLNRLARAERVIVSEVPGTTRDAIDVHFELGGHTYVAIDTAGMRRRGSLGNPVDYYAQVRSERGVRRCDVALLMIDATQELSTVDKNLASYVREQVKPCIIVINKWDLTRDMGASPEDYARYLRAHLRGLDFAPMAFVSAKTGFNVTGLLDLARSLDLQANVRVSTADVNRVMERARERQLPRHRGGRPPKVYYATQVSVRPPSFVIFVNEPKLFDERSVRYFENRLREAFAFAEVPIQVRFRPRGGRTEPGGGKSATDVPPSRGK